MDTNFRVFKGMKNNYSVLGGKINLEWKNGLYVPVHEASGIDKAIENAAADKAFLALLTMMKKQGRDVSPNRSNAFAPTVFARMPEASGIKSAQLEAAMEWLLRSGKIHVEKVGPPSDRKSILVICE